MCPKSQSREVNRLRAKLFISVLKRGYWPLVVGWEETR